MQGMFGHDFQAIGMSVLFARPVNNFEIKRL